jgi:hypothetical protein
VSADRESRDLWHELLYGYDELPTSTIERQALQEAIDEQLADLSGLDIETRLALAEGRLLGLERREQLFVEALQAMTTHLQTITRVLDADD